MKKLNFVLKKFYDKYFINLDFFDYFEKSFFILFIIFLISIESEFQTFLLKIFLVSITFWVMVSFNYQNYKNKNFLNPKKELSTILRENLSNDISMIFGASLIVSILLTNIESGNINKPIGIFLGLINYERLDSGLYDFSWKYSSWIYFKPDFFVILVGSLFFVFVILYLLSYLYLDMKYLIPERGGFSKKEYNLRCRTLEDIIKNCTNEKKLEEFINFIDLEFKFLTGPHKLGEDSRFYDESKSKHNRESMRLLLYQPVLKKFLKKYRDKPQFENVIIKLYYEAKERFLTEKEKGFEY